VPHCTSNPLFQDAQSNSAILPPDAVGDHIVAGDDLYGGTSRLLAQVAPNLGFDVTHVDTTDVQ